MLLARHGSLETKGGGIYQPYQGLGGGECPILGAIESPVSCCFLERDAWKRSQIFDLRIRKLRGFADMHVLRHAIP